MTKEVEQAVGRFVATLVDIASNDSRVMSGVHEIAAAIAAATKSAPETAPEQPAADEADEKTGDATPPLTVTAPPADPPPTLRMDQAARKQPAPDTKAKPVSPKSRKPSPPKPDPDEPVIPAQVAVDSLWPAKSPDAPSPKPELPASAYRQWQQSETEDELPDIARRCRLKATAARYAGERRQRMENGEDVHGEFAAGEEPLREEAAELPACRLWMLEQDTAAPESAYDYEQIARCYETLAEAAELIYALCEDRDPQYFERALNLLAESQSAVRVASLKFGGRTDADQDLIFKWLKFVSKTEQIYIKRHMRIADPADPELAPGILTRVRTLGKQVKNDARQSKVRSKRLKKITFISGKIKAGEEADKPKHWRTLFQTIDDLVNDGVPPSSREIRDGVIEIIHEIPETIKKIPPNVHQVMREIDSYIANLADHETPAASSSTLSPQVAEVAKLVAGRKILLIGGDERKPQKQAIEEAFGLSELVWFVTKEHHPVREFVPHVARDEVALVLLAIRWSSHSYREVNDFCQQYNKPLVRLPGGYNPNQIAEQVLTQCADRLRGESV